MNRKAEMNEMNHNHDLPEDLRSLDTDLARLARHDRASAPAGLESRLLDAVGGALAPEPISIERAAGSASSHGRFVGLAAAVLLVGSVGVLTVMSSGLFSPASTNGPNLAGNGFSGGGAISEVAFSDDVDLLMELVDSDYGEFGSDTEASYESQVDSVSLDVLDLDSRLQPAWDSLDRWADSYVEGAI